jgi:hypothetical protein
VEENQESQQPKFPLRRWAVTVNIRNVHLYRHNSKLRPLRNKKRVQIKFQFYRI